MTKYSGKVEKLIKNKGLVNRKNSVYTVSVKVPSSREQTTLKVFPLFPVPYAKKRVTWRGNTL